MPNGHDRNWIRFCAALDGFRLRHGAWPTRVRLLHSIVADLRDHLFAPEDFAQISARIEFVTDEDVGLIAEDDEGRRYDYGQEGFPPRRPDPSAAAWLGVQPTAGHD